MTEPTIHELLFEVRKDDIGSGLTLAERVDAVLKLHGPPTESEAKYADLCLGCDQLWPCPTIRALEGER